MVQLLISKLVALCSLGECCIFSLPVMVQVHSHYYNLSHSHSYSHSAFFHSHYTMFHPQQQCHLHNDQLVESLAEKSLLAYTRCWPVTLSLSLMPVPYLLVDDLLLGLALVACG